MKNFVIYPVLIILLCVFSSGVLLSEGTPEPMGAPKVTPSQYKISVKGAPKQGGILFVTIQGTDKSQEGECTWRGKKYALIWQRKALGVILPVSLDTPPGSYSLKITVQNPENSETITLERVVPIKAHNYGVQHIWLSQEQLNRYDDPQSEKDNNDIHNALSEYTTNINWDRNFIWPINGYTSTQFGLKRYYHNDANPEFHRGIDLCSGAGTPIAASQRGIVRFAKRNLLLHGTSVVIDHGKGVGTLYIHMSSLKVKKGDIVEQGDIIGTVGATGVATGPHLHWAAYVHDEPIDPHLLFSLPKEWLDQP